MNDEFWERIRVALSEAFERWKIEDGSSKGLEGIIKAARQVPPSDPQQNIQQTDQELLDQLVEE